MNDLTPDLIAAIASRLYNEIPGASAVPKSESDVSRVAADSVGGAAAVPPGVGHPVPHAPPHAGIPHGHGAHAIPFAAPTPPNTSHIGSAPSSVGTHAIPPTYYTPGALAPPAGPPDLSGLFAGLPAPTPHMTTLPSHSIGGTEVTYPGPLQNTPAGLREFVKRIQATGLRSENERCNDPGQEAISRLFATKANGKATPSPYVSRPFDVAAVRRDFPILNQRIHGKPLAWLDNAATTQKPQSVIDAISRFYAHDNSNIHRAAHTLAARATDAYEQARQKVQGFLGASSAKEIIFVRGTTEGINLIAHTYGRKFLQPGDEIVMSILEHHANIVPWQMIAKERGAVIRVIPVTDQGEVKLEEYQALLGPRTKLVALTHASNSLGTILPVAEMTQMAKRYNVRVLIDGAQSVAHVPVNVQQLGCDFYVFSGHKIFGPTGIGAVFAKQEVQEFMPPWQGGGNMIRNVTFEETTYAEPPARFEAGTPNIADAVGLGAALDYVNRLGLPNIAKYEHELLEYATERLSRIDGLRLIGTAREKVGVLSFVLRGRKTEEVGRLLDLEGIAVRAGHHCSQPSLRRFGVESTVRPSLSIYNTTEEVDRLTDAVKRIQRG
ncbi:cysteine desulfurase [Fimbriiglobus ruber]|uniref:Cysteine desulfurase n=1 Tax=Fimbriiglobus ruber TaxID=1908690 RepID=A0A225DW75_9BACT|nr:cysteine desulfurase [Fimbriiglobus ruber]OWK40565.1 Cysteine desulfurase [Fimbriiglobus ruber]